jgi:hypothetical protein
VVVKKDAADKDVNYANKLVQAGPGGERQERVSIQIPRPRKENRNEA